MAKSLKRREGVPYRARAVCLALAERWGINAELLGIELGVWKAESSAAWLRHLPELRMVLVDTWRPRHASGTTTATAIQLRQANRLARRAVEPYRDRCRILRCNTMQAGRWLLHRGYESTFDFAFVDADHRYESVVTDLWLCRRLVRPCGLICGDDYRGEGDKMKGWGVGRAVDEFVSRHDLDLILMKLNVWMVWMPP